MSLDSRRVSATTVLFVLPSENCRPGVHRQIMQPSFTPTQTRACCSAHIGADNMPGTIRTSVCRVFTNLLVELLGRCSMATHVCMQAVPEKNVRAMYYTPCLFTFRMRAARKHTTSASLATASYPQRFRIHSTHSSVRYGFLFSGFDTCLFISPFCADPGGAGGCDLGGRIPRPGRCPGNRCCTSTRPVQRSYAFCSPTSRWQTSTPRY